jgi:hypothetical protein
MADAKRIHFSVGAFVAVCAACFFAGWLVSVIARCGNDKVGTGEYEAGSAVADDIAEGIADGLQSVAGEMHGVGEQIADGITDVGELGAIGARIEQGSTESADAAGRIEAAVQRIESVLDEAEKADQVLDGDSGRIRPGGRD